MWSSVYSKNLPTDMDSRPASQSTERIMRLNIIPPQVRHEANVFAARALATRFLGMDDERARRPRENIETVLRDAMTKCPRRKNLSNQRASLFEQPCFKQTCNSGVLDEKANLSRACAVPTI